MTDGRGSIAGPLEVRRATAADMVAGREVVRASMGWKADEPNDELFVWKHEQSPFGPSPSWVALLGGQVVGFRTFMRWRFLDDSGRSIGAVRAVDTATLPKARGQGVFRRLTLVAVDELAAEGVGIVFNTPNDQSRAGYLTMGWSHAGRLPLAVRLRSVAVAPRLVRARVPARRWSEDTHVGLDASEALADLATCQAWLGFAASRGWRTDRTPAYLAWRFGLDSLRYRVLLLSSDPAEGALIFRLRRRGSALEAAVAEVFVSGDADARRLLRRMLNETGADYAAGLRASTPDGLRRVPGQGPILTTRPLALHPPTLAAFSLTLGDIELF